MRHAQPPFARLFVVTLAACALSACGGGGSGTPGGGGAGGGGGGAGGNAAPTLAFVSPTTGFRGVLRDTLRVSFIANDVDDAATVSLLLDTDGNPATQGDQEEVYAAPDADGATVEFSFRLPPTLPPGLHGLILRAVDGKNPPVEISLPRGLMLHPALAGVLPPRRNRYGIVGDNVVFSRGEAEDAAGPLNGDGDAGDGVFATFNVQTGILTQPMPSVSMDVRAGAGGLAQPIPAEGGVLAWLTLEVDEGRNLNGANGQRGILPLGGPDADLADTMVSFVVPGVSLTPITNTFGGAAAITARVDGKLVVHYQEAGEGNGALGGGSDLNFDFDPLDALFGYIDTSAVAAVNEFFQIVFCDIPPVHTVGPAWRDAGSAHGAMLVSEPGSAPGTDFNGDGDQADACLWLGDLFQGGGAGASANFHNLAGTQLAPVATPPSPVDPLAAFDVSSSDFAAYYVDEAAHNVPPGFGAGNDRNGDGVVGRVATYYHIPSATEVIPPSLAGALNSAPGASVMLYEGNRLFFTAMEAPRLDPLAGGGIPGTNGDGDNGADLEILYWLDHSIVPPVAAPLAVAFGGAVNIHALSLDGGGQVARLSPGWLAVIVSEAANGGQDINGSGAVDMAYLLVDTTTVQAPTVYNPGIVPSLTASMPLEGIFSAGPGLPAPGVVVRLTEAANGDLDGDGNGNEIFFAYISFTQANTPILLDAGGDMCSIAGGMIGVTAYEVYTGQDYDGNGIIGDAVFRVFDLLGNVIERGRLCSPLSVPATEDGRAWLYLRDEAVEGRSLNADGDSNDLILGVWLP
jgi:hypothetical protein